MPKRKVEESTDGAGPYPSHAHPTEEETRSVHHCLAYLHPEVVESVRSKLSGGSQRLVLDALVGTILSQNTTDTNSARAFAKLKTHFPTWESVRVANPRDVEEAIRSGGLAEIKTARIQAILEEVRSERGECSLEYLRNESDDAVKARLGAFKGVGAKTISCVLLFCLGRADFPVDTHVWKLAIALGWVPKSADRDRTYEHLNTRVPDEIKYELHVLLVAHGKVYKNQTTVLRKQLAALKGGDELGVVDAVVKHEATTAAASPAKRVKTEATTEVKTEVKAETADKKATRVTVKRERS
jgi:endonuclease-3